MPSRTDKESRLKDNLDKSVRRAVDMYEQDHRKTCPKNVKQYIQKELLKSAKYHVDKQLAEVWND